LSTPGGKFLEEVFQDLFSWHFFLLMTTIADIICRCTPFLYPILRDKVKDMAKPFPDASY